MPSIGAGYGKETIMSDELLRLAVLIETPIKLKLKETSEPGKRRALEGQLEAIKAIRGFSHAENIRYIG